MKLYRYRLGDFVYWNFDKEQAPYSGCPGAERAHHSSMPFLQRADTQRLRQSFTEAARLQ